MSDRPTRLAAEACLEPQPVGGSTHSLPADARSDRASVALEMLKWAFSFPAMLGMLFVGVAFYVARPLGMDPDVWWHIKDGESILATHHWPTTDPYSFTVHGFPWIAFEWLGDVVLAAFLRLGGVYGLEVLLFLLGSAILLGLYALGTISSGKSKAGFAALLLLTPMVIVQFNLRPQMLGYLFLILTMILLVRFRQGKTRTLWLLPLLMMVWLNSHGSWVIGMGTLFVYWIAGLFEFQIGGIEARKWSPAERRQISLVFLLSLVLLLVNPYGTELVAFPFRVAGGYQVSHTIVYEWLPMNFNLMAGKVFLFLVLGFVVAQVVFGFPWLLEELALCLFGIATACMHIRFVLLFVPFFLPLLARMLARWLPEYSREKDKYVLNAVLMAGAVAAMAFFYPTRANLEQSIADEFPVQGVRYIQEHHVPGPTFNSYGFGGYLVWRGQRVFLDGRSELFEDGGVLQDFAQLDYLRPGGLDVLRRYQIQSCLLHPDAPLATVLAALPEWQKVYSDRTSVLFVRRANAPALISQMERPVAVRIAVNPAVANRTQSHE
jgi:hypothetical protein